LPKGDPTPWIELGHALELAHEFDAALAAYDDAAREAPLRFEGPREGGLRAARWGLAEQASERLTEARRRGAIDTETLHALGLARLATGDADGARKAYDECTLRKPSAAECHLGLATVALRANDFRSALAAYDGVVAHAPNYAAAHLGRAWCLGQLGRTKEADLALRAAERMGASKEHVAKQRAFLGSQIGAGGGEAR
jgi:tetratricopeptide (TPR) repeat protein